MLLYGKNDNIIIPHLYYLVVYQDEEKWDLYKEIIFLWVGTKPQNKMKNGGGEPNPKINWQNSGVLFSINIGN